MSDERDLLIALAHFVLWPPKDTKFPTHNHALRAAHEALERLEAEEKTSAPRGKTSDWAKLAIDLETDIAKLKKENARLIQIGTQFSNVIYNLVQREGEITISKGELERLDELRKQWDKAVRER